MKAVCWNGKQDVRVESVPDPKLLNRRDAIVRITSTAICGSDLHLYNGNIPAMLPGDILGHEFMGIVEEVGHENGLRRGDRVVTPFCICCGNCMYCEKGLTSLCDNSNPNHRALEALYGFSGGALYGYSHLYGGFAGGQAQYVRVAYADANLKKVPEHLTDEQVLFLTDIFPTGYQAADQCDIQSGDTVAVWGCGPVGQFAIRSAFLLGAGRVIALDRFPDRLEMARQGGAEVLNYQDVDVVEKLKEMTGGVGPDSCIDAVGLEAHGTSLDALLDRAKHAVFLGTDRPHALRQAIQACKKGGTVSVPGVYGGFLDKFPFGAAFAKGLTFRMGQTHVHRYLDRLIGHIDRGEIDPSFIITHSVPIDEAPQAYRVFNDKQDNCIKVVLKP